MTPSDELELDPPAVTYVDALHLAVERYRLALALRREDRHGDRVLPGGKLEMEIPTVAGRATLRLEIPE